MPHKDPIARKEYLKQYTEKNKEKKRDYDKEYNEKNKDVISIRRKKYREENKEIIKIKKSTPVSCVCGSTYTNCHKGRHEKSIKHKLFLDNLSN